VAEGAAGGEPDLGFEVVGVELEDGGARGVERGGRGGGRGDEEERREDGGTHGGASKLLEAGQRGGDRSDRPRRGCWDLSLLPCFLTRRRTRVPTNRCPPRLMLAHVGVALLPWREGIGARVRSWWTWSTQRACLPFSLGPTVQGLDNKRRCLGFLRKMWPERLFQGMGWIGPTANFLPQISALSAQRSFRSTKKSGSLIPNHEVCSREITVLQMSLTVNGPGKMNQSVPITNDGLCDNPSVLQRLQF
jgi:hypothetical protein